MKFLLDENFPRSAAGFIKSCGHEAVLFCDACESGSDDEVVFATAQRLGLKLECSSYGSRFCLK